jgi:hypothetical protein
VTGPSWFVDRPLPSAIGITVALLALGFLVGSMGAFAHATRMGGIRVGLPVALLAQGAAVFAAGVVNASRLAAVLPVVGWVASVVVFAAERHEGSLVIAATPIGNAYLLGGVVLFGLLIVVPYERFAGPGGRPVRRTPKR